MMFHSDDDISLFVSFVDIPVSLSSLFQRIASINNRFDRSRLNRSIGSGVSRPPQYSYSPLGLEVEKVVVLWRGTNASGFYAAALVAIA